jgi:hypothetical protein
MRPRVRPQVISVPTPTVATFLLGPHDKCLPRRVSSHSLGPPFLEADLIRCLSSTSPTTLRTVLLSAVFNVAEIASSKVAQQV